MKQLLLFLSAMILLPFTGSTQITGLHRPPPDETINSGSIFLDQNSNFPFVINNTQKNRYGEKWSAYTLPLVKLNKTCDTLEMAPNGVVQIIKIGPKYFRVVKTGVEYDLKFIYRQPVVY